MASFATKPEQHISDSVGPLPEVCPIAGTHSARSPAFRTPTRRTDVIKPLIFIPTSDVSSSTPLIFWRRKSYLSAEAKSRNTHVRLERNKAGYQGQDIAYLPMVYGYPKGACTGRSLAARRQLVFGQFDLPDERAGGH